MALKNIFGVEYPFEMSQEAWLYSGKPVNLEFPVWDMKSVGCGSNPGSSTH